MEHEVLAVAMPSEMARRVREEAKADQRTVSGWIRVLVARHLSSKPSVNNINSASKADLIATKSQGGQPKKKQGGYPQSDRFKPLVMAFSDRFFDATGNKYPISWGRDLKALKSVASGLEDNQILQAMDSHFQDQFCAMEAGFSIPLLVKFMPKYLSCVGKKKGWTDYPTVEGANE